MTNSISSLMLWISIVTLDFKRRWMSGKMCSYNISARLTVKTDKFTYVYCNFLVLFSTSVYVKQSVNKADENLSDFNFLSRYHYTKSKNYLKRRYRIRHWIPMFIGKPCTILLYNKQIPMLFGTPCVSEQSLTRYY